MTIRWLPDSLFNRRALQEFILIAAQYPSGGLRDKPPKQAQISFFYSYLRLTLHPRRAADAYHTAYCISGLSAAQHRVCPSSARRAEVRAAWKGDDGVRATAFAEALCWAEEEGGSYVVGSAENRVVCRLSPCFNLSRC